ncbi:hypothetical protein EVAR_69781_1 [Eumeta japonica]|uniref:Uncharacterized protein n=1 Tax=Eumeta variegata TaxID=151549 RepID=A0A4C2A702_EUMVA|nr:hypothetical protein EVAR_69781_1 [Eumeta japonica]
MAGPVATPRSESGPVLVAFASRALSAHEAGPAARAQLFKPLKASMPTDTAGAKGMSKFAVRPFTGRGEPYAFIFMSNTIRFICR